MLATAGFPPFGANGLAFSADGQTLYVANTGDDRVLAMQVAAPNGISVFAESINGADGLLFDGDLLWVAANQADEVVALNENGRPVMRAGSFGGLTRERIPRGLLFPASLAFADGWLYVTNLALPLTEAAGDEPEEDVRRWTVSRIRVR
jgi:sugar lactone lactonase YvrE